MSLIEASGLHGDTIGNANGLALKLYAVVARIRVMANCPRFRRPKDFKPGQVTGWPEGTDWTEAAERARYTPDGKHKSYPAPNGEWNFSPRSDGNRCPPIPVEKWTELEASLREALRSGVVSSEIRGIFPARAWAYVDSTLCEVKLSNHMTGEYHGFPLDYEEHFPADPDGILGRAPKIYL